MKQIKIILLYINTLRHMRVKQIFFRIIYYFKRIKLKSHESPELRNAIAIWRAPSYSRLTSIDGLEFEFLNERHFINNEWNDKGISKLWLYNLHYQDYLYSIDSGKKDELNPGFIENWIDNNPPIYGNGWEPYCLSLRLVNWIKWLLNQPRDEIKDKWVASIAIQADALSQQIEYHILGNHLFANAKALVFLGVFIGGDQGDKWLRLGAKILDNEIKEQFIEDGAHFERSPMYHAIMLWDLCDLVYLQQNTAYDIYKKRLTDYKEVVRNGIRWLRLMVHPDGQIAFFNDAAFKIAPTLHQIEDYSKTIDCLPDETTTGKTNLLCSYQKNSGYVTIDWFPNHRAIIDIAEIGSDYQPGHAHADTLSFELSLYGHRVLVNSGISQYGNDKERLRQRSTAAHNTVEVDGKNSSEVWAGFRVAKRAKPFAINIQFDKELISVEAKHDGYYNIKNKVVHQRKWIAYSSKLVIIDQILGDYKNAVAYFHLHPDIEMIKESCSCWRGNLNNEHAFRISFSNDSIASLIKGTWHPEFGLAVSNQNVSVSIKNNILITTIQWG